MKNKRKVAVIAIAKNEAIYFSDWVAHHLFFGFHEIIVGVNRSNDSSFEVLHELSKHCNLKYENLDWVDRTSRGDCDRIQSISYAYLQTKLSEDITDVIFLDIDEFWFSLDFETKINSLVSNLNYSLLSFNWFCINGEIEEFSMPFTFLKGKVNPHVKTLLNLEKVSDVDAFRCHAPLMKKNSDFLHVFSNGVEHIPKGGEISEVKCLASQRFYILHRMCRSEVEYLSLLLRSRPKQDFRLKSNRNGFSIANESDLKISPKKEYFKYISAFRKKVKSDILELEIRDKINLSENVLNTSLEEIEKNIDLYFKVLKGTRKVWDLCDLLLSNSNSANALRDLAICFEGIDMEMSLKLMGVAHKLRPNGQRIIRKLNYYKESVSCL